ncbi:MAG: diguanylate cyclase [Tenericutes bacterium]|jgi:diguanylate cyclase (GGDEF)-like protein/PAS domain S-box-containing protein|nr:diguanylate cyclase [Mycoplasmatota bacterium]
MKIIRKIPRLTLYLFIILFFVVVSFTFLFLSHLFTQKQTEILTLKRELAVVEIENEFTKISSILETLSVSILIDENSQELEQSLNEINDNNTTITQMYYGKPDKTYLLTAEFDEPDGFDITDRPWYVTAVENAKLSYTDAYIDSVTNSTIMTIVLPVYDVNDTLIGVLGADIKVSTITSFVSTFVEEEKGYAFVLDSSGNVLAHTYLKEDLTELTNYREYEIPYDSMELIEGITDEVSTMSHKGKIAYGTINDSDLMFGVFMTKAELNQSTRTLTIVSLAIVALILAVTTVIVIVFNNYINRPLKSLISDIDHIDISRNPNYRMDTSSNTSFKDARLALNNLIEISVINQVQLEDSLEELSLQNQKFEHLLSSSSDIVFVVDINKRYLSIYGDIELVLGVSKDGMIGKTHSEVFDDQYAKEREAEYDKALNGEKVIYSWKNTHNETTYYFENVINPIYNHDKEIVGAVGVARDITEQENRYKQLVYISTHDYLTKLHNRKVYDDRLKELDDSRDYPFAVINLDFNGLKLINDAYGHEYGDLALKKTANILKKAVRENDTVCRVSGDEFSVIMTQATKKDVDAFKNKLKNAFKNTKVINIALSVAVGYYIKKDTKITLDDVRKLAENNMYKQKILDRKSVKNKAISAILKTLTDKYSSEKRHSERVMNISLDIGHALNLDEEALKGLGTAAMFHDIGKISIPDEILNKPSKLSKEEYEVIKTHTTTGYDILNTADEYSELAVHASSHHERYDGTGYPNRLKGDKIPLFSRIICVADAYEAMTSDRPYRKKMPKAKAVSEIIKYSGTQFDPLISKVFVEEVVHSYNEET